MNLDLSKLENRQKVLEEIGSAENMMRKQESFNDYEIFNDRIKPYVCDELAIQLGAKSAAQIPAISTLNVGKFVAENEATIYNNDPAREFENATESDSDATEKLYKDLQFNSKLQKSNKLFKYRNQAMLQAVPVADYLDLRVIQAHNLDVIPDEQDATKAYAVIVSNFDKSLYMKSGQDGTNQVIADPDDYKKTLQRFVVWTPTSNFVMNGNGDIVSEIIDNPIGQLPFVDIAKDKDYEFFIRLGQVLSDFTVQYNVSWSDLMYINRMQGFSVGVLKGDPNLKPESMTIAPAKLLFLPQNPNNPDSKLEMEFMNPNPNLDASIKLIEKLLANFLFMRGVDSKKISSALSGGSASYSSAVERLLALVDEFEATKEDFDLYQQVETKLFEIVKKYLVVLSGANVINPKYRVSPSFDKAELKISFHTPQMLETKSEQLENAKKKIDLGISDDVSILMELENLSEDDAQEKIDAIQSRKASKLLNSVVPAAVEPPENDGDNGETET